MSDSNSDDGLIYKARRLAPLVREVVAYHLVVVVTGARQVGKSTLLRHELSSK